MGRSFILQVEIRKENGEYMLHEIPIHAPKGKEDAKERAKAILSRLGDKCTNRRLFEKVDF